MLEAEEKPPDIGIEYRVVVGLGKFRERLGDVIAGAIGRAVEPAVAGHDLADDACDLAFDGNIEREKYSLAAVGPDQVERLGALFGTASGDNDRGSLFAEGDGGRTANARCSASNQRNFTLK